MRRLAIIGGVSMALVAAVACATSEEPEPASAEPAADPSIPDASVRDVAVGSDAAVDARGPQCSSDGWCETILPDSNLVVRDIWPLPDRAFAIARDGGLVAAPHGGELAGPSSVRDCLDDLRAGRIQATAVLVP